MCYHGTWARYRTGNGQYLLSSIDTSLCTHLVYAFMGLSTSGTGEVVSLDEWLDISLGRYLNIFTILNYFVKSITERLLN